MQKLRKIDEHTNVITWFEIPVLDTIRAKKFYETILDIKMQSRTIEGDELTFFPYNPNVIQATSGRVTGVLVKSATVKPSQDGTLIYLNAYPDIQQVIDRIESAGGKLLVPRTQIPAGYIAIFIDSEGNKIGIHAEE